ncbi:MAG: FAD-dependent oxidoreductase [Planctomycetes bacterium]|nr:FAD-dependent oxidoreductase [Planctomycetota bacterium]
MTHVVIIGAGFAGLEAAKRLRHAPVRITVIDRRLHHHALTPHPIRGNHKSSTLSHSIHLCPPTITA